MLFSILEMRLLLTLLKAQRPEAFAGGWDNVRRELGVVYAQFYAALIAGMLLIYYAEDGITTLVVLTSSFWVPQIVHQAASNKKEVLPTHQVVTITLTRMLPVVYFYGCPVNFVTQIVLGAYDQHLAVSISVWMLLQCTVVLLQQFLGPRFFVPSICLPRKYDFFREIEVDENGRVLVDEDAVGSESDAEGAPAGAAGGGADGANGEQ